MALPKKGTRKITVDSGVYRWLVRRDGGAFRLIAEAHAQPAQRLAVKIPVGLFPQDAQILSPALVKQCLVLALNDGYQPNQAGPEHRMEIATGQLNFGKVNREELTKRPVGRPRKRAPGEKRKPVYLSLESEDRERLKVRADAADVGIGTLAKTWVLERLDREERRTRTT